MSNNVFEDIRKMHAHFGVYDWLDDSTPELRKKLLNLRMVMLKEEFLETHDAWMDLDPEEFVDGLIDLIVIAVGTLDIFGVDANRAWDAVLTANMGKQVGRKHGRPNPLGLPDLVKPDGWVGPRHNNNLGDLPTVLGVS